MENYSDIQLLAELIKRNNIDTAPTSTVRYGIHYESKIAIGNNNNELLILLQK